MSFPLPSTRTLSLAGLLIACRLRRAHPPRLPKQAKMLRRLAFRNPPVRSVYWRLPQEGRYRFFWSDAGTFDLDARKCTLEGYCRRGAEDSAVEEVLRGAACSFTLLEHGFEPLHASSVLLEGRCVAFAGPSGAGKSSLCAYLCREIGAGVSFFSDDVLPLRRTRSGVRAYPGLPQLRLTSQSARYLQRSVEPGDAKSTFPVTRPIRGTAALGAVYVLARRNSSRGAVRCTSHSPAAAFALLAALTTNNSQSAPWRLENQLRTLGWVAENVPVRTLDYPSRFSAWRELRTVVLKQTAKQ